MITDVCAWTGTWNTLDAPGDVDSVRAGLRVYGVERIFLSPLAAAWRPNPHIDNQRVYEAAGRYPNIRAVPVLDPTLSGWERELDRAVRHAATPMVRILPAYGGYTPDDLDVFCAAIGKTRLALAVQVRMEDPRRQHPLAQVPDVRVEKIADLAQRHPDLTTVIAGASTAALRNLRDKLCTLPNLYADVSQADGLDALVTLVDAEITHKLLFGSHTPLFVTASAVARVVNDLNDKDATVILSENAARIFRV
ncbi:MAG: amidohydrolase family protein [candidate division Zixibacteria bacterium]|nr:amidohydrolase family protein [candidate division Zixibacteria bacterium]